MQEPNQVTGMARPARDGWARFVLELQQVVLLWLLTVLMLGLFRFSMILHFRAEMQSGHGWADIGQALLWGGRFDSMVATYCVLPSLLCAYLCYFGDWRRLAGRVRLLMGVLAVTSHLLICGITIKYYREFNDQFNQWVFGLFTDDLRAIVLTIWRQYPVVLYLLGLGALVGAVCWGLPRLFGAFQGRRQAWVPAWGRVWQGVALVLVLAVFFLSLRGWSIGRRPIKQRDIAATRDLFLNKWVANPYIALRYTILERQTLSGANGLATFLGPRSIGAAARQTFPAAARWQDLDELCRRAAQGSPLARPRHIFLIVCESYGAWIMLPEYRGLGLADELSRMADAGLSWQAFLPSGNGTIHAIGTMVAGLAETGIYLNHQPASRKPFPTACAPIFKRLGYRTRFIYAGITSWQRLDQFCENQGFDEVLGRPHMKDLPPHGVGTWGAHDEFFYRYVESYVTDDVPSFNLLLTTSNHPPYDCDVYRAGFPLRAMPAPYLDRYDKGVTMEQFGHLWYTDKCLGDFVRRAERKYPHALFAITGDHHARRFLNARPTLFEQYAVPFVLYGPEGLRGLSVPAHAAGSHSDIIPTLLELCAPKGFEYHSFGRNLLGTPPPEVGCNNLTVITPRLILRVGSADKPQPLPGQTLPAPLPDLAPLEQRAKSFHALAWWRAMKGSPLPPEP